MGSRTENALRNIIWGYFSKIVGLILPFLLRTVLIYKLGAMYAGISSLFSSVLQVLNISELGVGTAIVYSMYKPIVDNDTNKINALLNFYRRVYRIIGTVILSVGGVLVPFIPILISGEYPSDINIYFVYFIFLLDTVCSYLLFAYRNSLFVAFQRNDIDSKITTIFVLSTNILQIIVIFYFQNYYYYLFIILVCRLLQNVVRYYVSRKIFVDYRCCGKISSEELSEIKENVKALVCHKVGGTILNSADTIVISAVLGITMLTKYTNYYYILSSVEALIMICFNSITSGVGNSFVIESKEKNTENFQRVLFFNGVIVNICGTILAVAYQAFIEIWMGKDFLFDMPVVVLLINYFFIHTIRRTIITFRDAAGAWKDNQMQPIVSGGLNLLVNIILVNQIGIYGIVLSSILCMIFVDIPWETEHFIPIRLSIKSSQYYLKIIGFLVSMWIAILVSWVVLSQIAVSGLSYLIMCVLIGMHISFLFIFVFYHNTLEFKFFLNLIKRVIVKKKCK